MKIWVVVKIDQYGGDTSDCWCMFRNYDGVEVFTDQKAAIKYAKDYEERTYQGDTVIKEFTV